MTQTNPSNAAIGAAGGLYVRFSAIWGGLVDRGHDDALRAVWVSEWAVGISGLTKRQVDHALGVARKQAYPPSIQDFRLYVEDQPNRKTLEALIDSGEMSGNRVLDECARRISQWSRQRMTHRQLEAAMRSRLDDAIECVIHSRDLAKRLEQKPEAPAKHKQASPEVVAENLSKMRQLLGVRHKNQDKAGVCSGDNVSDANGGG